MTRHAVSAQLPSTTSKTALKTQVAVLLAIFFVVGCCWLGLLVVFVAPASITHVHHIGTTRTRDLSILAEEEIFSADPSASTSTTSTTTTTTITSLEPTRLLYIVTTLDEYNNGKRQTARGSDRFQETLIPVVTESVRSMVESGYHVDVFLIAKFVLRPERQTLLRQALPATVGLDYWDFATPLGVREAGAKLENRTTYLARQHRYVIKDKFDQYDMFVCFEDDMLIKGPQVDHFRAVTAELHRLRDAAPDTLPNGDTTKPNDMMTSFAGTMTKNMLKRVIPGFIRVEVLLDEEKYPAQSNTGPVPVDLTFDGSSTQQQQVNSSICCHVSEQIATAQIPASPTPDKLMLWETQIFPLGIRQMPATSWLDWVVLQRGPDQSKLDPSAIIGDYWSNQHLHFWPNETERPPGQAVRYINNQGGWMATREQIWEWHTDICPGGFLPPFEAPHYLNDGMVRNVEWYSGGVQLTEAVRHSCNMQRIIALDPAHFSHSLVYHTANNKQRQLTGRHEKSFVKANTLLGQLNALRKRALAELQQQKPIEAQ